MMLALSSEGGGATESFRIQEEEDEDRNSGETVPPMRTITEDVILLKATSNNLLNT